MTIPKTTILTLTAALLLKGGMRLRAQQRPLHLAEEEDAFI